MTLQVSSPANTLSIVALISAFFILMQCSYGAIAILGGSVSGIRQSVTAMPGISNNNASIRTLDSSEIRTSANPK